MKLKHVTNTSKNGSLLRSSRLSERYVDMKPENVVALIFGISAFLVTIVIALLSDLFVFLVGNILLAPVITFFWAKYFIQKFHFESLERAPKLQNRGVKFGLLIVVCSFLT